MFVPLNLEHSQDVHNSLFQGDLLSSYLFCPHFHEIKFTIGSREVLATWILREHSLSMLNYRLY